MKISSTLVSLIFILVITACAPQAPLPTQTAEVQPTQTASPSPTIVPATATDLATDLPESTPSPIPTLPLLPTLTPAIAAGSSSAYHLAPQTADQAEESIVRIEQIIPTLENDPRSYDGDFYPPYYRAAWYATWYALAHFPNDPRAESWRWKMAHYMALSGDINEANQTYSNLITSTLNTDHVSLNELPNHVLLGNTQDSFYLPSFVMEISAITIPHTNQGFIVKVGNLNHPDIPIAACFLLTETGGKYVTYFIRDSFLTYGYNILSRDSIDCSPKDVTDDGIDEIITNRYSGGHNGAYIFQVFDTTSLPPKMMPFFTSSQEENLHIWNVEIHSYPTSNKQTQIQVYVSAGIADCDNYYIRDYEWNGKRFDLHSENFHFGIPPNSEAATLCVDMALNNLYGISEKDTAIFLDNAIEAYRPHATELGDIFNELIVHKAAYQALSGEADQARSTLNQFVQFPGAKDSIWLEPAQKFLDIYQKPADLYRACSALTACAPYRGVGDNTTGSSLACVQTDLCDSSSALSHVISAEYSSLLLAGLTSKLTEIGVDVKAEGWLDFNQDHKNELWFTVYNPQYEDIDLWIGVETPTNGNRVFDAGYYEPTADKPNFHLETTPSNQIMVDFGGDQLFELTLDPATGAPMLVWTDRLDPTEPTDEEIEAVEQDLEKFRQLRQQLFSGNSPGPIYDQMIEIDRKYSNCPFEIEQSDGSTNSYYDCAAFYYTLAFSAELAGKDTEAVKRYYAVWAVYPDSPFAMLARLKLEK